jgi:hypothetical protein
VTLLARRERHLVHSIERFTGNELRVAVIPGLEPAARPDRGARSRFEGNRRGSARTNPAPHAAWRGGARPAGDRRRGGN